MDPEECRRKADEFRAAAEQAKDPALRDQLLLMVADWERLAADADELNRRREAKG